MLQATWMATKRCFVIGQKRSRPSFAWVVACAFAFETTKLGPWGECGQTRAANSISHDIYMELWKRGSFPFLEFHPLANAPPVSTQRKIDDVTMQSDDDVGSHPDQLTWPLYFPRTPLQTRVLQ